MSEDSGCLSLFANAARRQICFNSRSDLIESKTSEKTRRLISINSDLKLKPLATLWNCGSSSGHFESGENFISVDMIYIAYCFVPVVFFFTPAIFHVCDPSVEGLILMGDNIHICIYICTYMNISHGSSFILEIRILYLKFINF